MHPHRHRFDQCRALAGDRALTGLPGRLEHRLDVISVDGDAGEPVGRGALHRVHRKLLVQRRGVRVLVVLQHEHDREPLHAGPVHRFVEIAAGGGPVAEPGQRAARLSAQLEGHRHSRRDEHHVGEHRDHPDTAQVTVAEVDVAVPAAGDAGRAAHVLGEDPVRGDAADQMGGEVPVQDAQPVLGTHRERGPGGDRLLAETVIERAGDLALAIQAHRPFLNAPHQQHRAQQPDPVLEHKVRVRRDRGDACRGRANDGLRRFGRHVRLLPFPR